MHVLNGAPCADVRGAAYESTSTTSLGSTVSACCRAWRPSWTDHGRPNILLCGSAWPARVVRRWPLRFDRVRAATRLTTVLYTPQVADIGPSWPLNATSCGGRAAAAACTLIKYRYEFSNLLRAAILSTVTTVTAVRPAPQLVQYRQ